MSELLETCRVYDLENQNLNFVAAIPDKILMICNVKLMKVDNCMDVVDRLLICSGIVATNFNSKVPDCGLVYFLITCPVSILI